MRRTKRFLALAAGGVLAAMVLTGPVTAQEAPEKAEESAGADHAVLFRIVDRLELVETVKKGLRDVLAKRGGVAASEAAIDDSFEQADWAAVRWVFVDFLAEQWTPEEAEAVDVFLDSQAAKGWKVLQALEGSLGDLENLFGGSGSGEPMNEELQRGLMEAVDEAFAETPLFQQKLRENEHAAIRALRDLVVRQAQAQTSGRVDVDRDGIGEYATLQELAGAIGVRIADPPANASDGSITGTKFSPVLLEPSFGLVNEDGIVTREGYCFRVFLPDAGDPAGFTHESRDSERRPGFGDGSARVSADGSETRWAAYAWPVAWGKSGYRCFFVNQGGDVLQSANGTAKWSGYDRAPTWDSALVESTLESKVALGTAGRDGEIWKVTN